MIILALSAGFVGLVHSLAPGHWLPVVLMAKAKKWPLKMALLGALTASSGHIFLSIIFGFAATHFEMEYLQNYEHQIESYSGLALATFGFVYAVWSFYRHHRCVGHTHHGPKLEGKKKTPFVFLFTLGFSPCIAALPIFVAIAPQGVVALTASMMAFALGVIAALVGATILVSLGAMKLDHPVFEHYGEVITGIGIAVLGLIYFLYPI